MPAPDLLSALRNHLVTAAIVRKPSVAGAAPPLWLEPRLGTPAPGEGNNPTEVGTSLVIGAYYDGGISTGPYESVSWIYRDIQIVYRGLSVPTILNTDLAIRAQLIDRRDWMLNGTLYVLESSQVGVLSPLVSDEQGYDQRTTYRFQLPTPTL